MPEEGPIRPPIQPPAWYSDVLDVATHLRHVRASLNHLGPTRELSLVGTHIDNAVLWLQAYVTARQSGHSMEFNAADPNLSMEDYLAGFHLPDALPPIDAAELLASTQMTIAPVET